jgi:hypothetical protein
MEGVINNVIFVTPVFGVGISYLDPERVEIFRVLDKNSHRMLEWFLKHYTLSCNFHLPCLSHPTMTVHSYPIKVLPPILTLSNFHRPHFPYLTFIAHTYPI